MIPNWEKGQRVNAGIVIQQVVCERNLVLALHSHTGKYVGFYLEEDGRGGWQVDKQLSPAPATYYKTLEECKAAFNVG